MNNLSYSLNKHGDQAGTKLALRRHQAGKKSDMSNHCPVFSLNRKNYSQVTGQAAVKTPSRDRMLEKTPEKTPEKILVLLLFLNPKLKIASKLSFKGYQREI